MTILDDTAGSGPTIAVAPYQHDDDDDAEQRLSSGGLAVETSALLGGKSNTSRNTTQSRFFQHMSPRWVPGDFEDNEGPLLPPPGSASGGEGDRRMVHSDQRRRGGRSRRRSVRRRFFLFLTEPDSSLCSAAFFFVLIFAIFLSNVIMVMQTMDTFQYTPTDCHVCGGEAVFLFDDDNAAVLNAKQQQQQQQHSCVCPPEPLGYLKTVVDYLMYFFAVEWTLRVLCYCPHAADPNGVGVLLGKIRKWIGYVTSTSTLIDALAIWPYFFETLPKGLVSLRLLRLFRVFQLVRLGQYNTMFVTLTNVLQKSAQYLKLMVLAVLFGAALFGSLLFWLEQGTWKYWEPTGDYQYIRTGKDGVNEEISPFKSIPSAFWWFVVTATSVGYGDYYPTSAGGQWVAVFAMLSGVLVIAFPVGVFSDLWSEELKEVKGFQALFQNDDDDDDDKEIHVSVDTDHLPTSSRKNGEDPRNIPTSIFGSGAGQHRLLSDDPTYVVMKKDDLNEIVGCLHSIRQNQRQIQNILRKYSEYDN